MKLFGFFKQISPEKELMLIVEAQPVVMFKMLRNNSVINGLLSKK
jgi:hypothetical protein